MKKHIMLVAFMLALVACSGSEIPLPPEAKESKSACPEVILHLGGKCYSVPKSHNETIAWYEEKAKEEGWTFNVMTDDEPFSFMLTIEDKNATITFYRQPDEKSSGFLIKTESN
ncbi:hypothetical protein [Paenibacillus mendelii]|uniref:Lipoprotein n=1 Tax=Paenibacillus mendelii TaxID=206163 RepID=A0ABV6J640_9BACL|nr:hypothetical protein [Paenibacillus mendelii]MCQ6559993.1 hypothetical protein [Paenibacillus mendelii]